MNRNQQNRSITFRWLLFSAIVAGTISVSWKMLMKTSVGDKVNTISQIAPGSTKVDKDADRILKAMSDYLTSMKEFSYKSKGTFEVVNENNKKQTQTYNAEVFVKRPNKLRVNVENNKRNASVFYDGSQFAVLGRNANMYAQVAAPPTLDAALDSAREKFLLDPPGSDILYTDPYKGWMETAVEGKVKGEAKINGVSCHHLAYQAQDVDWEIWIEKGSKPLPRRYKIISKKEPGKPEFVVDFSDWKQGSGPDFADNQFVLNPPANSRKIPFMRLGDAPKASSEQNKPLLKK